MEQVPERPGVIAFDIIETVFTIEPLRAEFVAAGLPGAALETWFAAALRDLFALAATGSYAPFRTVLEDALAFQAQEARVPLSQERTSRILDAMGSLPPHGDAAATFGMLRDGGHRLVSLSNGSAAMTGNLLKRAGLAVEKVISIDEVGVAKPRREAYLRVAELTGVSPGKVMLIASHPWDIHGAKSAGLGAAYVARGRPFPGSMRQPDIAGSSLQAVAEQIMARSDQAASGA